MNDKLLEQLRRHEGFRSRPYDDGYGNVTIGYGRNLDARGITKHEAEFLLRNDVESVYASLASSMPNLFTSLNAARRDVLVNMAFNLGYSRFAGFRKFLAALRAGDYELASREMLDSLWARQVGARANELAEQMRRGEYAA